MKKIFVFVLSAGAILAAACSREAATVEGEILTITALFEDKSTKTTLQDGGTSVYWEPGDEVKLFYKEIGSRFTSTNTEIATVADFTGTLNVAVNFHEGFSSSTPLWGLYPYRSDATSDGETVTTTLPSEQTARAGSFDRGMNISLGKSTTLSMGFYNVCGGLRFSLTQPGIKDVIFKGQNGESIAGKVKLTFEDGVPVVDEVIEGVDSIVLKAPGDSTFATDQWYYIVALPGTLSGGFEMTFNKSSQYATLKKSSSVSVIRSIFGQIANADEGLNFKYKAPDYVDLGLSVKWAAFNIGASKPEEYGNYYAWGDVTGQIWNGSEWSGGGFYSYPSYEVDANGFLKPEYDAAVINLGGRWRMPTTSEFDELISNCTSNWTSDYNGTGVAGRIFTSNKEGYTDKSIFLPAAGYGSGGKLYGACSYGRYWTSNFTSGLNAWTLYFDSRAAYVNYASRSSSRSVRPVCGESNSVIGVGVSQSIISIYKGLTYRLTAIITPANAANKNVIWSSSDESVASVSSDGVITANVVGSATITVTTIDGGKTASCIVTVIDLPDGVDLGLSVKWATSNVGAAKPEEYGNYYAWGDVVGQAWNDSSWSGGGFSNYPEYELDENNNLKSEYDAAHVNLGGSWRMPTLGEYQELIDNCTSTWTSDYNGTGVSGRIFTSKKEGYTDKSIFLPAAGCGITGNLRNAGSYSGYWSSTFNSGDNAWYLTSSSSIVYTNSYTRYYGRSVRPVTK